MLIMKMSSSIFSCKPFIGFNIPFIGVEDPRTLPYVSHNIPSVTYWPIFDTKSAFFRGPTHERGFSMIELLVTVTIFIILGGLAIPAFMRMIEDNRITTQANSFIADIKFARSEAIKRSSRVAVCISNLAGTDCGAGANPTTDWKTRQRLIWNDTNTNNAVDPGETILRVREPLEGNRTFFGDPLGAIRSIGFDSKGLTDLGAGVGSITLAICYDSDGDGAPNTTSGRDIIISFTGTTKVVRPATAC